MRQIASKKSRFALGNKKDLPRTMKIELHPQSIVSIQLRNIKILIALKKYIYRYIKLGF